jgi:hypothetical protein
MLDLVHLNVCGPMQIELHSGFKYFLTFIDDKSRKSYITVNDTCWPNPDLDLFSAQ